MAFPKFEDWEAPWKEGEFDAEKAAKLIYNLSKDKHSQGERITTLRSEVDGLKDERDDLTDERDALLAKGGKKDGEQGSPDEDTVAKAVQAALAAAGIKPKSTKEQRREAEQADGGSNLEAARLRIALKMGLTEAQANRLVGKTAEELEADAEAYIEEHGLGSTGDGDGEDGGEGGQAPPSQRAKVRTGTRRGDDGPDPYAGMDPGKLYDTVVGVNA